jgi:hypothetical protein
LTVCLFDTSSLERLAYLKAARPPQSDRVINQLNSFVTTAHVPLLALMESVRNSHVRYQYGKRGQPVTPEYARQLASQAFVVVSWCNGLELSPSMPEYDIARWPLDAKIKMVPLLSRSLPSIIEDLARPSNFRCTANEGFHILASSIDHLILGTARALQAVLITQDERLAAAAHHLHVPYRRIEDEPDLHHLWRDCQRDDTCLRRLTLTADQRNDFGAMCTDLHDQV